MTSSNGNIFRVTGTGEFPTQRPVTRSFDVFFDLRLYKRFSKQPWGWWFEKPSWPLWRQWNVGPLISRRFSNQAPTVNEDLPNRILSGQIITKGDVHCVLPRSVLFEDDSLAENVDIIILATGYKISFPYLEPGVVNVKETNEVDLYSHVFSPHLEKQTLAVIGCVFSGGPLFPIFELQARWACSVFKVNIFVWFRWRDWNA